MTRKVNVLEAVADIQSGKPELELMEKYGLAPNEWKSLLKTLTATNLLSAKTKIGTPARTRPAESAPEIAASSGRGLYWMRKPVALIMFGAVVGAPLRCFY